MRFRSNPTAEQREALRAQLTRLQQPAAVLESLHPCLPNGFQPARVTCVLQSMHSDRFVMLARVRSHAGEERAYALKVYADDFSGQVWAHSQAVAERYQPDHGALCLPIRHIPHERTLVFPWVEGVFLSEIVDERKTQLLRQAAGVAADLHRLDIVPEGRTTPEMLVEESRARCDLLRDRWPETAPLVEPLMDRLGEAVTRLDSADPAPVHSDLGAGQFLWTGDRLVLLDLDMFGYADAAYDVGHFLAQVERRCVSDRAPAAVACQWLSCFREAYLTARPQVSPRNVSFYRGLTLVRKIYSVRQRQPTRWPTLVPQLAARARGALEERHAA